MEKEHNGQGKQIIDRATWSRVQNFDFFRDFVNPNIGVTVRVDALHAFSAAKAETRSFFLRYFHAILSAANAIEEFHYRIDREDNIVRYNRIDGLATIRVEEKNNFAEMRFPYKENLDEFCQTAREIISQAASCDPYEQEECLTEYDVMLVSALPGLDFTSICSTQRSQQGNDYPLCIVGKMGCDHSMPIALTVHHGFIDGEHITKFFDLLQKYLNDR